MFVCGVPKDSSEFARVLKVEQRLFGELSLPPAMAHQMFDFRPEIYAAVVGPDDRVAAYSSIYPLKKKWADAFVAGDITEPDLTTDMLLTRQDCHERASIHIRSGVVGGGQTATSGPASTSARSWSAATMMQSQNRSCSPACSPGGSSSCIMYRSAAC